MSDFGGMVEDIQNSISLDQAFSYFNKAIQQYGYNNACYTLMTDHPSIDQRAFHGLATSYPEDWLNYYNEKEYQKFDAVWLRALDKPAPFFWRDAIKNIKLDPASDLQSVLLAEKVNNEAEDAGLADGIGLSFVSRSGEIGISRERREKTNNVQSLADIYYLSAVFNDKYLSFFTDAVFPKLTKREMDVLSWSSEGKIDLEIAQLIGISHATVRFHWNNIFRKMNVNNKVMATTIAIRRKLISPQRIGFS